MFRFVVLPPDWTDEEYRRLNKDIRYLTPGASLELHYLNYGIREGRRYKQEAETNVAKC